MGFLLSPSILAQVYRAIRSKRNALAFQTVLLGIVWYGAFRQSNSSLCIDDPVPGNVCIRRQSPQCQANPSGCTGHACFLCDRTISRHFSLWNGSNHQPDSVIGIKFVVCHEVKIPCERAAPPFFRQCIQCRGAIALGCVALLEKCVTVPHNPLVG